MPRLSAVGISALPAQAVAAGQGRRGCQLHADALPLLVDPQFLGEHARVLVAEHEKRGTPLLEGISKAHARLGKRLLLGRRPLGIVAREPVDRDLLYTHVPAALEQPHPRLHPEPIAMLTRKPLVLRPASVAVGNEADVLRKRSPHESLDAQSLASLRACQVGWQRRKVVNANLSSSRL